MTLKSLSKAILYFLILFIVFWSKDFFLNATVFDFSQSAEPIFSGYSDISKFIFKESANYNILGYIFTILLTIINALYIARITVRFNSNVPKSFISLIVFLCLTSISVITKNNIIGQLITFFLLSSSEKQIYIQQGIETTKYSFLAAFYIGLAAILAPIYYCFLIIILVTHIISTTVSFREISASVFGMLTPLFFASYTGWLLNDKFLGFYDYITDFYSESFLRISLHLNNYTTTEYTFFILLFTLCVISVMTFLKYNSENSTKFEYIYYLFLITALLAILILFTYFSTMATLLPAIIIGLTSVISMMVVQTKKKSFRYIIIYTIIIFSILLNFLRF